ncbi:hypothetical protein AAMO2058_001118100 [Amorphochlora amoebiformis]
MIRNLRTPWDRRILGGALVLIFTGLSGGGGWRSGHTGTECCFQISGIRDGQPSNVWYDLEGCQRDSNSTWRVKVANNSQAIKAGIAGRTRARVPLNFVRRAPFRKFTTAVTEGVTRRMEEGVTHGVTKGVTRGVTKDVTRGVTKDVTRGVTKDVTRGVTKDVIYGVTEGTARCGMYPRSDELEVTLFAGCVKKRAIRDGHRTQALFHDPLAITSTPQGHLYITERAGGIIRHINTHTGQVSTVGGVEDALMGQSAELKLQFKLDYLKEINAPRYDPLPTEGDADDVKLEMPHGIAFAPFDDDQEDNTHDITTYPSLYIADSGNDRIQRIRRTKTGYVMDTLVGKQSAERNAELESDPVNPKALDIENVDLSTSLCYPLGVTVGYNGEVFIADTHHKCVRYIPFGGIRKKLIENRTVLDMSN